MSATALSAQERLDLFAVYLSLPGLHHLGFEEILTRPVVLGCLRNTLEAMRRRQAKVKAKAARESTEFVLT
jgi:hypothetical protein